MKTKVSIAKFKKIRKSAISHARQFGPPEYAEDFGSYMVLNVLSGARDDVKQRYTDFLRETLGDTRNRVGRARALDYHPTEYRDILELDLTRDKALIIEMANDLKLSLKHRIVFILRYHWGLTMKEIGVVLGVSEGMASYICKDVDFIVCESIHKPL